jgi:hypothetical protein
LKENEKLIGYQFGDVSDLIRISFSGIISPKVVVIKLSLETPTPVLVQFAFSKGKGQIVESRIEE